jgi:hypothetical protein
MRDPREIQELEPQIALDKHKYSEIERLEAELMENIPPQGFSAVSSLSWRKGSARVFDSRGRGDAGGARSQPN